MTAKSQEYGYFSGRDIAARMAAGSPIITMDAADVQQYKALEKAGIGFDGTYLKQAAKTWAMDDVQGGVFTPGIPTPVQFLQTFLPGFVRAAFAPRKIDELVGISTVGHWHDEEVVQGRLETMGEAVPYSDIANVPLSSWNAGFERRTVVRFEKGMKVGRLEAARAGAMRLDSAAEKRTGAQLALDMQRNEAGFVGYNDGTNRTYGLLNDPALPAYVTVAAGAGGSTKWETKTYREITADLRQAFTDLQVQSNGVVDGEINHTVLALPVGAGNYLSVVSDYGNSVRQWLTETYPKCRVVSVPQFAGANGGANVFYLYAETVDDSASDDSRVWVQAVPNKFMALGIEQTGKAVVEDFTNATAGVMLKRPYAVYRATGI